MPAFPLPITVNRNCPCNRLELLKKVLTESLAGRFYLHRLNHWSYREVKEAFGLTLDEWLFFGGYPGALNYIKDEAFWSAYVRDSLIETVIAKDVLQLENINKPTLLRHVFYLAAYYPAEIFSYNKMSGQLTDAGNTTTLAHYISILVSAFLLSGLEQFKRGDKPKKGSSPKLILWNNALISSVSLAEYSSTRENPERRGRLVENAVGAHFLNTIAGLPYAVYYWRKGNWEVDFVVASHQRTIAVEVKSSRMRKTKGLPRFLETYPSARSLIIGGTGMPLKVLNGARGGADIPPLIIGGTGMPLKEFFLTGREELLALIEGEY